jgi:HK97 gp10 family phage protein
MTGLKELRHAVKAYGQNLVAEAVDAVTDATEDTAIHARYLAEVDTGKLRDSITASVTTDGYAVWGVVNARARHASFVEGGTEDTPKKPFLAPPAIRNQKRLQQRLKEQVVKLAPDGLGSPRIVGETPATPRVWFDT